MRILHTTFSMVYPLGQLVQMSWEQQAATQLGIDWKAKIYTFYSDTAKNDVVEFGPPITPNNIFFSRIRNWFILRFKYYRWLKLQEDDTDIYIIRYSSYDIFQLIYLIFSNKPTYLIHHTLEIPEILIERNAINIIKAGIEKMIGRYSIRKCAGIIGVTQEIIDYEKKRVGNVDKFALLYPNGIIYNNYEARDKRGSMPELLFISSYFFPWHGLDLLIDSIKENHDNFILHIIGDLSQADENSARSDSRIILHGRKNQREVELVSEKCWVGLSAFALYRNNMHEACSLKVRQYLMMGLPVYSGHKDVFPEDFAYHKAGNLCMTAILEYAFKNRDQSRKVVSDSARMYIDKLHLLQKLANQLMERHLN